MDKWTTYACPECDGGAIVRAVRASATTFGCPGCGREWAVRRMPTDAEAARIRQRSRQQPGGTFYRDELDAEPIVEPG